MQLIDSQWLAVDSKFTLSVVITSYNYANYIKRSVSSVVRQLVSGVELIVIDDGSTDDSVAVLAQLNVPADVRAGYTVQKNRGPAAARNAATQLCRGTWILFLDADDELLEGGLLYVRRFLQENADTDLLLCGSRVRHQSGKEVYQAPDPLVSDTKKRLVSYLIEKKIGISHGSSVFRRNCVIKRPYPEHIRQGEDIAVFAFMLSQPHCRRLDVPLVRIYKHKNSLRHDVDLVIKNNEAISGEVFSSLPSYMSKYIETYRAKRALSAFRSCYRAGRKSEARRYFHAAVSFDMRQALRFKYISKYMALLFRRS